MGAEVDIRGRSPRTVPATETGDDLPDLSGEPSRSFGCDSNKPVAFALDDPTAGSAFWPSVLPTCSRCARKDELAPEVTESVGLLGRSSGTSDTAVFELVGVRLSATRAVGLRTSRVAGGADRDVAEPLIIASLRRRSSKGVPGAPRLKSALIVRFERGVPNSTGLRTASNTAR